MTCCEGWTSCNGFSLLILLLLGVVFNIIPIVMEAVEDQSFQNPISCFEWWYPGIIGAGVMVIPATTMSLAARKRACCNNRTGMLLSSFLNIFTIIGAVYCMLVSLRALSEGPLICNSHGNSTTSCEFSFKNLRDIHPESFDLQWFLNESCITPEGTNYSTVNNDTRGSGWGTSSVADLNFNLDLKSKQGRYRTVHFSVFLGLLLVGILELLFGLSQTVIGFLGCLCGVSKRRSQIV
ncbi:transmembrane 4 L6 family member 20 [Pteropus medius]|uniref:Transmembrane 4 L6 family member 20 n=1 Tax=Pteropus vampyrus TaxID=132908 RepID=A0A6P3QBV8_PTEVA|nr:transmembrane 4 L6 family member 20 [Pteropus vampyrus]XP_039711817.1 transmembrane 4 L6 family member 20 [Pteropus giganteus]